jgi:hypothetical protein
MKNSWRNISARLNSNQQSGANLCKSDPIFLCEIDNFDVEGIHAFWNLPLHMQVDRLRSQQE